MSVKGSLSSKLSAIALSVGMMGAVNSYGSENEYDNNFQELVALSQSMGEGESAATVMQRLPVPEELPTSLKKEANILFRRFLFMQEDPNKLIDRDLAMDIISGKDTDRVQQNSALVGADYIRPTQKRFEAMISLASGVIGEDDPTKKEKYKQDVENNFPMINILVVKSGNEDFDRKYQRAIWDGMQKVTQSFEDPNANIANIIETYPEKNMYRYDGKSTAGGILVYVNDWDVIPFHPKSFDNKEFTENIKRAMTYMFTLFEKDYHLMSDAEHDEYFSNFPTNPIVNAGDDGSASSGKQDQTPPDLNPG
ncbi:MAG: hypothetical protein ACRBDI_08385 [Alphaproteobacteria bacterium]